MACPLLTKALLLVEVFCYKAMNDNLVRFKGIFRIYMKTFNFLFSILNDDLICHLPHAFEVGICARKLKVEKQVAISLSRLATSNYVITIGELFKFL
jgi:hypothetical protein